MLYGNKWKRKFRRKSRKSRAYIVYSLSIHIHHITYVRWKNSTMNAAKNMSLSQNQGLLRYSGNYAIAKLASTAHTQVFQFFSYSSMLNILMNVTFYLSNYQSMVV